MKTYININTLEYPLTESTIKQRHKNISWPVIFKPTDEYAEVVDTPKPPYDLSTSYVVESTPIDDNGTWKKTWEIVSISPVLAQERRAKKYSNFETIVQIYVQNKLDAFAKTRGYESILSACTYATSSIDSFRIEGQRCIVLRDGMWAKAFQILNDCFSGARPIYESIEPVEAEFPRLSWTDQ